MPFLDWVNKNQARASSTQVPYHLLQKEAEYGAPSENMVIQGDNLLALRALMPLYAGRIKCIFIDPPYNTQSAFEQYDDKLEHSQWLSMMYPRLVLLRDLLSEDGSIWITIDDNESHYLKVICDEIFGRLNFVATCVWEKDKGGRGDADISLSHDNILVYAKSRAIWSKTRNLIPRTETQIRRFKNPDNDPRGLWRQGDDGTAKSGTEKQRFPVTLPSGRVVTPPPGRYWAFSQATLAQARDEGRAYFGVDGDRLPIIKRYLTEVRDGVAPRTWWSADEVGTNQQAKRDHLNKLLTDIEPFATPKPEGVLQKIIHIATNTDDLVLDSFLGSGTTAAVAHKMGRRYIGIEMGEHAKTHCIPRLQKVIEGEQGGISQSVEWQGGGGFGFYTLHPEPVFQANGQIRPDIKFEPLAAYIWHMETGVGSSQTMDSPLLGVHNGIAYYLLYNGILGDRRPQGGNVLTRPILAWLQAKHPHDGPKVIYGESIRIGEERLVQANVTFKQIPYDVVLR